MGTLETNATHLPKNVISELKKHRIVISGGNGFLGSNLKCFLRSMDIPFLAPSREEVNFEKEDEIKAYLQEGDHIVHLAALCGGIQKNIDQADEMFDKNLLMGIYLFRASREKKAGKILVMGTPCEYPNSSTVPLQEEHIWDGLPNPQTGAYGMAKRMLAYYAMACSHLLHHPILHLIPVNLYGKHNHFHPTKGHVIPGLITRMFLAKTKKEPLFPVWGSGHQTREFLHAEDACRGILLALSKEKTEAPINLGTGIETSISEIANIIKKALNYSGELVFDPTAPVGVSRRLLDISKAEKNFQFKAKISLEEGIPALVDYFLEKESQHITEKHL